MSNDDVNRFLQGGEGKSFPFENIGDTVSGIVKSFDMRQQTDFDTGKPSFWDDGKPKMMLVVNLQTELQTEDDDDGVRVIYARGGNFQVASGKGTAMSVAIRDAMKRAGASEFVDGAKLTIQHSGLAVPKGRFQPAKLYTATYQPPVNRMSVDELL
jgi:hypothetical protein